MKFLLGNFRVPRSGVRFPREAVREVASLTEKAKKWSKEEEKRVVKLVDELKKCTVQNRACQ